MTSVFVGGSRRVSRLNADVRKRLDRVVQGGFEVLIGDANGADRAVQQHLVDVGYQKVRVFCSGDRCRNNLGNWPTEKVSATARPRTFAYYAEKDRAMAQEASFGLMLWDGSSKGTLLNAQRLARANKPVVIYVSPSRQFTEIRAGEDWQTFISACPPEVRAELSATSSKEDAAINRSAQQSLL